jgi:hypothetical protein
LPYVIAAVIGGAGTGPLGPGIIPVIVTCTVFVNLSIAFAHTPAATLKFLVGISDAIAAAVGIPGVLTVAKISEIIGAAGTDVLNVTPVQNTTNALPNAFPSCIAAVASVIPFVFTPSMAADNIGTAAFFAGNPEAVSVLISCPALAYVSYTSNKSVAKVFAESASLPKKLTMSDFKPDLIKGII